MCAAAYYGLLLYPLSSLVLFSSIKQILTITIVAANVIRYFRPKMLLFTSYSEWMVESKRSLACSELVNKADLVIELTENAYYTSYDDTEKVVYSNKASISPTLDVWKAQGIVFFPSVASDDYEWYRWGIMYVANCDRNSTAESCSSTNNCQGPTALDFEMKMMNGHGAVAHLSADESSMLGSIISFGFLQLINFAAVLHTRKHLVKMKKYHVTVRYVHALYMLHYCIL